MFVSIAFKLQIIDISSRVNFCGENFYDDQETEVREGISVPHFNFFQSILVFAMRRGCFNVNTLLVKEFKIK